jgi:2-polyprenyl-6-hydroxyphenyl methylase/3-demethylubiquinone-9 3-methyltransferase
MRFAFGKNWQSYSQAALTLERIDQARLDFRRLVNGIDLRGRRFLDIGFGQGLSLIAAMEAGADVLGIDIDKDNLAALEATVHTIGSKQSPEVRIVSILDRSFVDTSRQMFDVVHSWGVLHHTGDMRQAIENACSLVAPEGHFVCSIYNTHWSSPLWKAIKWSYNRSPAVLQHLFIGLLYPLIYISKWLVTLENPRKKERGMDFFHDVVDWVGGYPYEYSTTEEICALMKSLGFDCLHIRPAQVPTGCNQFVFRKQDRVDQPVAPHYKE